MQATENTTAGDYIRHLDFVRFETYSFRRRGEIDEAMPFSGATDFIITPEGEFHESAVLIGSGSRSGDIGQKLEEIFCAEGGEVLKMLCAPFHRDAIIFYDRNGKIASALNICMSCHYLQTAPSHYIWAGYLTFDKLKRLLLEIGHPIENPTIFLEDDLKKHLKSRGK